MRFRALLDLIYTPVHLQYHVLNFYVGLVVTLDVCIKFGPMN